MIATSPKRSAAACEADQLPSIKPAKTATSPSRISVFAQELGTAARAAEPSLAAVQKVYLLPMVGGLDQYLADQITREGLFTVVVDPKQADAVWSERADAGLTAYKHNLDTSRRHYPNIVTTRTYQDRLQTMEAVRAAGISLCSGGIIGMGESLDDRAKMLQQLANQPAHPESVPINALVPVDGTPLEKQAAVDPTELVRMIAVARILMPSAMVRLSAGRKSLSPEALRTRAYPSAC